MADLSSRFFYFFHTSADLDTFMHNVPRDIGEVISFGHVRERLSNQLIVRPGPVDWSSLSS